MRLAEIIETAAEIVEPPPDRSAWQWADDNRVLQTGSAEPGPWRTSRVPYTIEPYEAASDARCQSLVLVMGAQMSKTEFELNVLGHRFDDGPYVPALYVGPTQKQVSSMSRDRFQSMLKSVPSLWDKLAKGQDDKITEKFIGGIRLGFAWAGSPTELSSHPAGLCVIDERDRMDSDISGEGDPVELVRARLSTYTNKLLVIVSTPTTDGASPIMVLFDEGTKRIWHWTCKHCAVDFMPRRDLLYYPDSLDYGEVREGARVHCPECGGEHEDRDKTELNARGRYHSHLKNDNGDYIRVDIAPVNRTWSYWVNGLCSPWVEFGERAERLAKAIRSNDQKTIQAVVNTGFGEPYKVSGEAPEQSEMYDLVVQLPRGTIPADAKLLTAGCDVQKNGIYYVIRSWSFNDHSHLVDHGFIHGDTVYDDVWIIWQSLMLQKYDRDFEIMRGFVDSGYNPGRDQFRRPAHKVYEATWRTMGRMMPSKGHAKRDRPLDTKKMDLDSRGRALQNARSVTLWHIDTDHFKTWIRSQVQTPENLESKFTLHNEVDDDYCNQMIAEELIVTSRGREWIAPGSKANHYFDCEVLARAAAVSLRAHRMTGEGPNLTPGATPQTAENSRQAVNPRLKPRAGGFRRR